MLNIDGKFKVEPLPPPPRWVPTTDVSRSATKSAIFEYSINLCITQTHSRTRKHTNGGAGWVGGSKIPLHSRGALSAKHNTEISARAPVCMHFLSESVGVLGLVQCSWASGSVCVCVSICVSWPRTATSKREHAPSWQPVSESTLDQPLGSSSMQCAPTVAGDLED